jgi:hypothetical protein
VGVNQLVRNAQVQEANAARAAQRGPSLSSGEDRFAGRQLERQRLRFDREQEAAKQYEPLLERMQSEDVAVRRRANDDVQQQAAADFNAGRIDKNSPIFRAADRLAQENLQQQLNEFSTRFSNTFASLPADAVSLGNYAAMSIDPGIGGGNLVYTGPDGAKRDIADWNELPSGTRNFIRAQMRAAKGENEKPRQRVQRNQR